MSTTVFERRIVRCWCLFVLLCGAALIGPASTAGQSPLAIVVHPENPLADISLDELRRLFRGRSTSLGGVDGVTLYQHKASRDLFYSRVLNETLSRATRSWMAVVFSGGAAVPPTDFDKASDLVEAVAGNRTALGFVPLSEVDSRFIRVLRVDGLSVGAAAYPVR